MQRQRHGNRRGLSLVEIICAIGFLSVFTTGLLAIATKGLELSRQQVDVASAYEYGQRVMEIYANQARDPGGWTQMAAVSNPAFPKSADADQTSKATDKRFVYTVKVDNMDKDLRMITVVIYVADQKQAKTGKAAIDRTAPRQGELLRFTNVYQQEVNNA